MTLPTDSEAKLDAAIARVADTLADGFGPDDLAVLVRESVEIAEAFGDLDGTEKKALALAFIERVIDECFDAATPAIEAMVVELDLPGPEWVERAVWDPLLKRVAPMLLRPALHALLPKLIDLVVDAARGSLAVNK